MTKFSYSNDINELTAEDRVKLKNEFWKCEITNLPADHPDILKMIIAVGLVDWDTSVPGYLSLANFTHE